VLTEEKLDAIHARLENAPRKSSERLAEATNVLKHCMKGHKILQL
jgi:hypothetical protein